MQYFINNTICTGERERERGTLSDDFPNLSAPGFSFRSAVCARERSPFFSPRQPSPRRTCLSFFFLPPLRANARRESESLLLVILYIFCAQSSSARARWVSKPRKFAMLNFSRVTLSRTLCMCVRCFFFSLFSSARICTHLPFLRGSSSSSSCYYRSSANLSRGKSSARQLCVPRSPPHTHILCSFVRRAV